MLDLLFLASSGPTLPSVRFRVLPYVERARARGLAAEWRRIPKTGAGRLGFFLGLPKARVAVVQKKLLSSLELGLIRRRAGFVVFDFDDALWARHPGEGDTPEGRRRAARDAARLARVCAGGDLVVAGNAYLAERVAGVARRVEVLPTPLDTDLYVPPAQPRLAGALTVGWMGAACNLFFLPEVLEALVPLGSLLRALVVSDADCMLPPGLAGDCERWSPESEIPQLQRMDLGLMPLTDDEYTRGKCGFKLLQYMACGAVPVASDLGFNREIVTPGQDGFLVNGAAETAACVERLARDPGLRQRMAQAARAAVVERFSLAAASRRLFSALGL
jgi:hypothetical protein